MVFNAAGTAAKARLHRRSTAAVIPSAIQGKTRVQRALQRRIVTQAYHGDDKVEITFTLQRQASYSNLARRPCGSLW
jgi:hypothetical protein